MVDLNDLYFFVQVVDYGGFSAAARALGVPKSRLSRRIAALEDHLDVRLIQRTTRQFSVTEIGRVYYDHCKAMLVEAQAAQDAIEARRAEPRGLVRVSCPVALLHAEVDDMLVGFMAAYPRVSIQLEATNRRVDPVAEGIDVALRVRRPPLEDSELVMRMLSVRSQRLVASPGLFEQGQLPAKPGDLEQWPSLHLGLVHEHPVWRLDGADGVVEQPYTPRLVSDDLAVLRQAALAGLGVVQLPKMLVRDALQRGDLIELLPDWAFEKEIVHAVFASRRGLLPSVRALIDYLAEGYRELGDD